MASFVKFTLEDGTIVYIESSDVPKGSGSLIPRGGSEHAEPEAASFEKSVEAVRKMASVMLNGLRDGFEDKPSEIGISFGLKASAELGSLVVARAGMESNFNVSLRWYEDQKDSKEKDQEPQENAAEKQEMP